MDTLHMIGIPVWAMVGSMLWHIRGGMFGAQLKMLLPFWGTTISRLSYSALILLPLLLTHIWYIYIACWLLLYVGTLFKWGPWQYLNRPVNDTLALTARGLLLTGAMGVVTGSIVLGLSGATLGVVYLLGTYMPQGWTDLDGGFVNEVTTNQEYLFGLVFGALIMTSVLFPGV